MNVNVCRSINLKSRDRIISAFPSVSTTTMTGDLFSCSLSIWIQNEILPFNVLRCLWSKLASLSFSLSLSFFFALLDLLLHLYFNVCKCCLFIHKSIESETTVDGQLESFIRFVSSKHITNVEASFVLFRSVRANVFRLVVLIYVYIDNGLYGLVPIDCIDQTFFVCLFAFFILLPQLRTDLRVWCVLIYQGRNMGEKYILL